MSSNKPRVFTEEEKLEIIKMTKEHFSQHKMASKFQCGDGQIRRVQKELGIAPKSKSKPLTPEIISEINQLNLKGISQKEIASKLQVSLFLVSKFLYDISYVSDTDLSRIKFLRGLGTALSQIRKEFPNLQEAALRKIAEMVTISSSQKRANRRKHAQFKYDYDLINSPDANSYYLLGAFLTDGHITKTLDKAHISSKDKQWLESMRDKVSPLKPVKEIKGQNCWLYTIANKDYVEWFLSQGVTPNKSLTVKMPSVPDEFFPAFLNGVISGDGCVYVGKDTKRPEYVRLTVSIYGASFDFMNDIFKLIKEKVGISGSLITYMQGDSVIRDRPVFSKSRMYRCSFAGNNAVKLCEYIFQYQEIVLQRKLDKFLEYKKWREEYEANGGGINKKK